MKKIPMDQHLVILSCHKLLWAVYYGHVSISALSKATFLLDCDAERVFQDFGDLTDLINTLPNHDAAIGTYCLVRDAVATAKPQGRVAYRSHSHVDPRQLNELLVKNDQAPVPPLHENLHTQEEIVVAALGTQLSYFIVWEGLLNQIKSKMSI